MPQKKKTAKPEKTAVTRGFKGFDKDLKCRGMRYEVGKTFTAEGEPSLCENGLHFCEHPFHVWDYYGPATSRFCAVESDSVNPENACDDTKRVASSLRVCAEIGIPGMVKAGIEYIRNLVHHCASTGSNAHCVSTGDAAHCASTGRNAHCVSTGDYAHCASTGFAAHCASTGFAAHCVSTGDAAHCASTGSNAHCVSTGRNAHCVSTGDYAHCATKGKNSISAAIGREGRAMASIGGWVVLSEYDDDWNIVCVRAAAVNGQEGIKPDTWYALRGGEFVQVEGEE